MNGILNRIVSGRTVTTTAESTVRGSRATETFTESAPVLFKEYFRKGRTINYLREDSETGNIVVDSYYDKGNPRGAVSVEYKDGRVRIGWCKLHKNDRWNKNICDKIIQNRMEQHDYNINDISLNISLWRELPETLVDTLTRLMTRVNNYHEKIFSGVTSDDSARDDRRRFGRDDDSV